MTARALAILGHHFVKFVTFAYDFEMNFAIYPRDNFSCKCSISFEQEHFIPVSSILGIADLSVG